MTKSEMLKKLDELIEESKVGVLATVHKEGRPHIRWMTPALIKGHDNSIYTVTSTHFPDSMDLEKYPEGEWMIQARALDEIINIKGNMTFIHNPSLNSQVMESLGDRLTMYWKVNKDEMDFLVMEMSIKSMHYFHPMKGTHNLLNFSEE